MGKMPGGDRAFIDPAKIAGYLLNPFHRVGRHKARVFASVLDIREENAPDLIAALTAAARDAEAVPGVADRYGVQYAIAFTMEKDGKRAVVLSIWIIRPGEDFPRFVTAFVAKQEAGNE